MLFKYSLSFVFQDRLWLLQGPNAFERSRKNSLVVSPSCTIAVTVPTPINESDWKNNFWISSWFFNGLKNSRFTWFKALNGTTFRWQMLSIWFHLIRWTGQWGLHNCLFAHSNEKNCTLQIMLQSYCNFSLNRHTSFISIFQIFIQNSLSKEL